MHVMNRWTDGQLKTDMPPQLLPSFGHNWTASSEFGTYRLCEQRRFSHTSSVSRGTSRQKARSLAPMNGWACAVKICHDGMLEDTNSLDGAQLS